MADTIVQGLFGMSPYDAQLQREAAAEAAAMRHAQLAPLERAASGMYRAGGLFGDVAARGTGMVNPREVEAQQTQGIMSKIDATTADGLLRGAQMANQIGNARLAYSLAQAAQMKRAQEQQLALEQQKAALSERKQDFQEREALNFKYAQLNQQYELAKERAEDRRLSEDARLAEMARANDIRQQLGLLRAGLSGNIEKPMTEAQRFKVTQSMQKDKLLTGQVSQDAEFLRNAVDRLKSHPGLAGMTGWKGYFPSVPETSMTSGDAKAAETILQEIKGRTATLGRIMASAHGKLGNMAVQEWKIVADSLAALDPKSKEFTNQLDNLVAQVNGLEARTKAAYGDLYENYSQSGAPVDEMQPSSGTWKAETKDDVKQLLTSGRINRATAKKILMDMDKQGKL